MSYGERQKCAFNQPFSCSVKNDCTDFQHPVDPSQSRMICRRNSMRRPTDRLMVATANDERKSKHLFQHIRIDGVLWEKQSKIHISWDCHLPAIICLPSFCRLIFTQSESIFLFFKCAWISAKSSISWQIMRNFCSRLPFIFSANKIINPN